MNRAFVVIDPGQSSGYLAVYRPDEFSGFDAFTEMVKCPATIRGMYDLLSDAPPTLMEDFFKIKIIPVVEKVHANIKHGSKASFGFGMNYGAWLMGMRSLDLEPIMITPQRWKKYFGLWGVKGMTTKQAEQAKVMELFPGTKISQNAAGVILIAVYAASILK